MRSSYLGRPPVGLGIQDSGSFRIRQTCWTVLRRSSAFLVELYPIKGRLDDARAIFREAYQAAKRLVAEHPESLDYRFALALYESQRGTWTLAESASLKGQAATAKLDEARRAFAD